MTYSDFFIGTAAIFALFIIVGLIHELLWWRTKRMLSKWLTREFKARKIYIEGEPDPATSRGAVKEFEAVKRMYSGRER